MGVGFICVEGFLKRWGANVKLGERKVRGFEGRRDFADAVVGMLGGARF